MTERTYASATFRIRAGKKEIYRYLNRLAGANRFMWNQVLEALNAQCEASKEATGKARCDYRWESLSKMVKPIRDSEEYAWLQDFPYSDVRASLKRLSHAFKAFVKGQRKRPKFKAKYKSPKSFDIETTPGRIREDGHLRLKRGMWVKLMDFHRAYRHQNPVAKGATIWEKRDRWYVTVRYEVDAIRRECTGIGIGVDRNTGQVYDSEGREHRMPDHSRLDARINQVRRKLARQQKGSNRRKKTLRNLRRLLVKRANRNKNAIRHIAKAITSSSELVFVENLSPKAMTKSARGTVESPGKNVKAKAALNAAILDTNWGYLLRCLRELGYVIEVPAAYTSQRCSGCGHTAEENRKRRRFCCVVCGLRLHADYNAALNIRASGVASVTARGGHWVTRPVNREQMSPGLHPAI